jgi:hypothetical protein
MLGLIKNLCTMFFGICAAKVSTCTTTFLKVRTAAILGQRSVLGMGYMEQNGEDC